MAGIKVITVFSFMFLLLKNNPRTRNECDFLVNSAIILLSFTGAIGILLVVLGCALPQYGIWWPFFVLMFYLLAPVPTIIANRLSESYGISSGTSNLCKEISLFLTSGIVLSAFGLPIVLARSGVIEYGAMALVFSGNVMMFCSILAYFIVFESEDDFGF